MGSQDRDASAALAAAGAWSRTTDHVPVALRRLAGRFRTGDEFRLLRYIVSGVAVSTGYTVTVLALVDLLHWLDPVAASTVSFIVWTPVSYAVHRDFTFRFRGHEWTAAAKFIVTFVARLLASAYVVYVATAQFELHYLVGVLLNWIVLPLVNYLALSLWVFRPHVVGGRKLSGIPKSGV